ncbi:MAG: hypothetical protein HYR91_13905 [Flavobacteriia bacterium]|nr:hypothetical protein [Flavobacteriia bacterium]
MTIKKILPFTISLILLFSCKENKLDVSISNVQINTQYIDLDSIIFYCKNEKILKNHQIYKKRIPDIYDYQIGYCLQIGRVVDTAFVNSIVKFRADPFIQRLEKRIREKFKSFKKHEESINNGLKHLKVHFPKGKIPTKIVFMNSLFRANAWSTNHEIGIGIERYLGNKTDVIQELPNEPFYDWIKEGMDIQFLERDALCSWIMTHYVPEKKSNLAESIITWGKIIYLTEAAFPDKEKHQIIRYAAKDYQWALENEYSLWKFLVDEKKIFKNDEREMANFLNDGPFTIGLPEKGPDRLGQFIGWRMIQKYMEKKEITLTQLMKIPYNEILQEYEIED